MVFQQILVLHNFTLFVLIYYKYSGTPRFPSIAFYLIWTFSQSIFPYPKFSTLAFRLTLASKVKDISFSAVKGILLEEMVQFKVGKQGSPQVKVPSW